MKMCIAICAVLAGTLPASADHDHHGMTMEGGDDASFGAGISLLAAEFGSMFYAGDYQGVVPRVTWTDGRVGAMVQLGAYRLDENGRELNGLGDAMIHAHVSLVSYPHGAAGVSLGVSAPTGDEADGLGMGHVMVMPDAWATYRVGRVTFAGTGGYNRALAELGDHVHGMWPLVEPMNMSELTASAGADLDLGDGIAAGARLSGAEPVQAPGVARAVGAVHLSWRDGRITTGATLEAGIAGDPFTFRGVVETALSF